jgi:two-component system response regulator DesR
VLIAEDQAMVRGALPDERVTAGDRVLDPAPAATAAAAEGESPSTPRETEVLGAARGGEPVMDLAGRLHLSAGTVRNYRSSAMQKLGAHSRAEAVRVAEDKGWL